MFRTVFTSSLLIVTCLLIVGCTQNKGEVPVAGRLIADGKPVVGISISFVPDDMRSPGFVAQSLEDGGRFEMRSFTGTKGVLPGEYSVQLSIPEGAPGGPQVKRKFIGPASPWRVAVTDKGIADLQLDMDKEKLE